MDKKYLLLFFVLLGFTTIQSQTTYVKHDAAGANDGSSWENAFTDLSNALENTSSGNIWVAAGTYQPGSGIVDTFSRFEIGNNIGLFGGFSGTESSLEDRDITANVTHLSGDLAGDDVDDDFDNNKIDNVLHVVYVDSLLTSVTIDGFTITGGYNNPFNADLDIHLRAGAGIFVNSPVAIINCNFRQNFAGSGAAVITNGASTSGSFISNCLFENNYATDQAILYIFNQTNTSVEFCQFRNNTNNRGALYPNSSANISISDCIFENNINPTGYGAGMWSWQNIGLTVTNCNFTNNAATNSAAFYCDGRNIPAVSSGDIIFTNCNFTDNTADVEGAAGWAGAGMFWDAGFTLGLVKK